MEMKMSESIDSDKKELVNSHGNDTERTAPRQDFRYKTVFNGSIDNFGKHLMGRILSIELSNNKIVTGRLKSFGQYDVILTDSRTGQDILLMKSAIITIQGDLSPRKETA